MDAVSSESGVQHHCVEQPPAVDGRLAFAARDGDIRGAAGLVTGNRRTRTFGHESAFDLFARASKFHAAIPRVRPLLSTVSGALTHQLYAVHYDESPATSSSRLQNARNPYQRSFAVVFSALGVTMVMSAYQDVVLGVGISGCGWGTLFQEDCKDITSAYVTMPLIFRQLLCYAACVYILCSQLYAIRLCRRMVFDGQHMTANNKPLSSHVRIVSGHWTAVASQDILAEVSSMIAENQLLAVAISGATTVLATLALTRMRVTEWQGGVDDASTSSDQQQRVIKMCCAPGAEEWHPDQCSHLCRVGAFGHVPFVTFDIGILSCLICSMAFIPPKLWSPVTEQAVKACHMPHMQRMLRLPSVTAALCVVDTILLFVYILEIQVTISVPGFWISVLFVDIAAFLAHLAATLSTIHWKSLSELLRKLVPRRHRTHSYHAAAPVNARRTASSLFRGDRHSRRYRQLVLGVCGMFSFGVGTLGTGSRFSSLEIWIIRSIIVLLLVFAGDLPADFEMLETNGAGFGLVLDARQLSKVLKCHLAGKRNKGRVKRYKGTLLRMCDTMAVSYRWQDTTVTLDGLGVLNMRTWQMESLVDAIRSSGCLYVWLDAFSVPQEGGELKRVLLSRMMAVYASSFVTVAMLSCEAENERYHQRVWTLQEYCSSGQLIVLQEPAGGGKQALMREEAMLARQLRREHMARQLWCVPMWLNSNGVAMMDRMPAEDSRRIWETYKALRDRLSCKYPEDSIRALYPLLWNRPAESQDELIRLMGLLESVHGIPHQGDQIAMFKGSSHRHFESLYDSSGTGSSFNLATSRDSLPQMLPNSVGDDVEAGSLQPSSCSAAPIGK